MRARESHLCHLANRLWYLSALQEARRFIRSASDVEAGQRLYLERLLRRNAATDFGKRHGFARIRTVKEFRESVPVSTYEDYGPSIAAIAAGKPNVLTSDAVLLFEPTSGTSSGSRLIPYTASLKAEFLRGVAPWIVSLFRRRSGLMRGRAYWSISPAFREDRRMGVVPVGFSDDSEYLGAVSRWCHAKSTVVPPRIAECRDPVRFRRMTLVSLLAAEDLRLISVWSPTFLTILLNFFVEDPGSVLDGVERSGLSGAAERARSLRRLLRHEGEETLFSSIWPALQVISCWTHGPSASCVEPLRRRFPTVEIQPKGLLATEAFVSLPISPALDPVLSVRSHFFEFQEGTGETRLAHELEPGGEYTIVVTTGGGLYRYNLGDRVRVTGSFRSAPTVRFLGKAGLVSDRFGEKLSDAFVSGVLEGLLSSPRVSFALLAPDRGPDGWGYTLFLESDEPVSADLALRVETALERNPHYGYCIELGQLRRVKVFRVEGGAEAVYMERLARDGRKAGDIKSTALSLLDGWSDVFRGNYVYTRERETEGARC